MPASESPLYPAALALSLAASLRVRARPGLLLKAGGRSDVFNASTCLVSANLVIALAGVFINAVCLKLGLSLIRCLPDSEPRHEVRQGYPLNLSI